MEYLNKKNFFKILGLTIIFFFSYSPFITAQEFRVIKKEPFYYMVRNEADRKVSIHIMNDYEKKFLDYYPTGEFEVPSKIEDEGVEYTVTVIEGLAFEGCKDLKSIKLPNTIDTIRTFAFQDCESLVEINIPNTVRDIEWYAFYNCTSLKSITLSNSMDTLKGDMFRGCSNLEEVNLPNTLKHIGMSAFENCGALTKINIPDSLHFIESHAFAGCTSLGPIRIPTQAWMTDAAFLGVETIIYDGTSPESPWGAKRYIRGSYIDGDFVYVDEEKTILAGYIGNAQKVTIPSTVTTIQSTAFIGNETLKDVTVPNSVVSIENNLFKGCKELVSVQLSDNITEIGDNMFMGCENLSSITLPNSITSIGTNSFYGCKSLSSVEMSTSVDFIGDSAFMGCENLLSIVIPNSVDSIRTNTFNGCVKMTSVTLPETLISIGDKAFLNCESLTPVALPNTVEQIGLSAFKGCVGVRYFNVPESVTSIGADAFKGLVAISYKGNESMETWGAEKRYTNGYIEGDYVYADEKKDIINSYYGKDSEITIPDGIISIASSAFRFNSTITSVVIPEGVISIDFAAFGNCENLASVVLPESLDTLGSYSFSECEKLTSIELPEGIADIGGWVFSGSSITTLIIPDDVKFDKSDKSFEGVKVIIYNGKRNYDSGNHWGARFVGKVLEDGFVYEDLNKEKLICYVGTNTDVIVPENVKSIGISAFSSTDITSIVIPSSVTIINSLAFYTAQNLVSVSLPSAIKIIYSDAFGKCTSLASITLPESIDCINSGTFSGCSSLTEITIPKSVLKISEKAFANCENLKKIEIFNPTTQVYFNAFDESAYTVYDNAYYLGNEENPYMILVKAKDANITSVDISPMCKTISEKAFMNCKELTSVVIPNSVENIGSNAFENCTGLTSVMIPNSIVSISSKTFASCSGLTSVIIPNSVTYIGSYAFENCTGLTSVSIPNSVTGMGSYVFEGCTGLMAENNARPATLRSASTEGTIYCQVEEKPEGWSSSWKPADCKVMWNAPFVTIEAKSNNDLYGTVSYEGSYLEGSEATLIANSAEGFHFVKWSDGNLDSVRTVVASEEKTLTAIFASNLSDLPSITSNPCNILIYTMENVIVIENAIDEVMIYNMAGQIVNRKSSVSTYIEVPVHSGVYVVKTGNVTKNIIVR